MDKRSKTDFVRKMASAMGRCGPTKPKFEGTFDTNSPTSDYKFFIH